MSKDKRDLLRAIAEHGGMAPAEQMAYAPRLMSQLSGEDRVSEALRFVGAPAPPGSAMSPSSRRAATPG